MPRPPRLSFLTPTTISSRAETVVESCSMTKDITSGSRRPSAILVGFGSEKSEKGVRHEWHCPRGFR